LLIASPDSRSLISWRIFDRHNTINGTTLQFYFSISRNPSIGENVNMASCTSKRRRRRRRRRRNIWDPKFNVRVGGPQPAYFNFGKTGS